MIHRLTTERSRDDVTAINSPPAAERSHPPNATRNGNIPVECVLHHIPPVLRPALVRTVTCRSNYYCPRHPHYILARSQSRGGLNDDTAPPRARKYERTFGGRVRGSPVGISSSSLVTQQPAPTWPTSQKQYSHTNPGGAAAASDSHAITCSSSAGLGRPRSKSCGEASGSPASGNTRERRPSGCFSMTREQPWPFCSFCEIQGRADGDSTPLGEGR